MLDEITQAIYQFNQAPELYRHRLIMLVMASTNGSQVALERFADQQGFRYVNTSLELSSRLVDIPKKQHSIQAARVLNTEIVGSEQEQTVILDNLAILHEPSLKLDPVRWLLEIARRRIVVATWAGDYASDYLTYAEAGHPEYNRYLAKDMVIVRVKSSS